MITGASDGAIDQNAQVEFALDVQAFFDEQALHEAAPGPVCGVTSFMPRILEASSRGFVRRARQLDAAALAAAAGMNLRFDHDYVGAELRRCAASRASSLVKAISPRGVGTP